MSEWSSLNGLVLNGAKRGLLHFVPTVNSMSEWSSLNGLVLNGAKRGLLHFVPTIHNTSSSLYIRCNGRSIPESDCVDFLGIYTAFVHDLLKVCAPLMLKTFRTMFAVARITARCISIYIPCGMSRVSRFSSRALGISPVAPRTIGKICALSSLHICFSSAARGDGIATSTIVQTIVENYSFMEVSKSFIYIAKGGKIWPRLKTNRPLKQLKRFFVTHASISPGGGNRLLSFKQARPQSDIFVIRYYTGEHSSLCPHKIYKNIVQNSIPPLHRGTQQFVSPQNLQKYCPKQHPPEWDHTQERLG
ncbi:hypothetical protein QE152_g19129 [Popillia japonica]|uniref:Uncharacterized protein n=1 Tax=Popillia japonica TaxID=7064 RepID=A0AAW1L372_POPJA